MARAAALDIVTRDFVTVARLRGESAWSIMRRELLPNATSVLLVEFALRAGYAPVLIGSLGFLGFGLRPPTPEWGLMISENRVAHHHLALRGGRARPDAGLARGRPQPLHRRPGAHPRPHGQAGRPMSATAAVAEVVDLDLSYRQGGRWLRVLHEVSFAIARGEVFGLVGESGCGKSTLAYQLLGYRQPNLPGRGRQRAVQGRRPARLRSARARPAARQSDQPGAAESHDRAQPGHARRAAGRGGAAASRRRSKRRRRARTRRRALRPGRPAGSRQHRQALPARAVGRPAAARLHRDGAGLRAGPGRAGRADDRARRHDAGSDHRAARRTCAPASACRCSM